jgi:hypothetical protein
LAQDQPVSLSPADRAAIHRVIQDQIAAFRRDDASAAFALASPSIQERFGTPENFMSMVRSGYQAVYRPRQVRLLDLVQSGGVWVQRVLVIGPDGIAAMALYPMVRLSDGSWRTGGCALAPLAAQGA